MALQKLLSLKGQHFLTGIAPHTYSVSGGAGIFQDAKGITPIKDPERVSDTYGILQAGPAPTDISGAVVVDTPRGWVTDITPSGSFLYMPGNDGHFYKIDISGASNAPTDLRSGTQIPNSAGENGPTGGVEIFQPRGGSRVLYYWYRDSVAGDCRIGSWNLSGTYPTGWNDTLFTGLQDHTTNPTHTMFDEIYYGNKDRLGRIKDDGAAGITHSNNVLDFPSDYQCTTISDDGVYLVSGITKNLANTAGGNTVLANTKLIFWDKNSPSWQREWIIPAPNILSIRRVGTTMYAITGKQIYKFTFNNSPEPLFPDLSTADTPNFSHPTHNQAAVIGNSLMWAGSDVLHTYGQFIPTAPIAYHKPITTGAGADIVFVAAEARLGTVWFADTTDKLWRYSHVDANDTSVSASTIYFDLGGTYKAKRIDLVFEGQLTSGDSLNIDIQKDDNISVDDWGTASFATYGAVTKVQINVPQTMTNTKNIFEQLKLIFNFNAGAVKIKQCDVWGERITRGGIK